MIIATETPMIYVVYLDHNELNDDRASLVSAWPTGEEARIEADRLRLETGAMYVYFGVRLGVPLHEGDVW